MKIGGLDIGPAHAARRNISIACWLAGLKEISTKPESQDGKPGCNIARESVPLRTPPPSLALKTPRTTLESTTPTHQPPPLKPPNPPPPVPV